MLEQDLSLEAREWLKYYADCNLKDLILGEIETAIVTTAKSNHPIIVHDPLVAAGLKKCVMQAKGLAQRNAKDLCYYLTMSLSPGKRWFYNFVVNMKM